MTQYTNFETEQNADEIKADIERTRNKMSNKIDEIQDRFRPEQLKDQAQEVVRSAVQDSTEAVVSYVRTHSRELSGTVMDTIKRNPVPAAMVGLGLGWIMYDSLTNRSSHKGDWNRPYGNGGQYSQRYGAQSTGQYGVPHGGYRGAEYGGQGQYGDQSGSEAWRKQEEQGDGITDRLRETMGEAREKVGDATNQVTDQIRDAGGRIQEMGSQIGQQVSDSTEHARHQMERVGSQAQDLIEENPFAVGLVALGVGVALGMALPSTRRENQMLGEWRDQAVDRARQTAGDVVQRVQEVVEEVKPELEQTASKVVDDLARTGKQAADEVKESVKKATNHSPESPSTATEETDLETESFTNRQ